MHHVFLGTLAAATGCLRFSAPCGPKFRTAELRADIVDSVGVKIASASSTLSESQNGAYPRELYVGIMYAQPGIKGALDGHLEHIRLLDRNANLLQKIEFAPGNENTVPFITRTVFIADATTFDNLRTRFVTGDVVLELETDLGAMARMRIPFPLYADTGWVQSYCD